MTRLTRIGIGCLASALASGAAWADGAPTAKVLGELHHSNQMEIAMGKVAQSHGASPGVMNFGAVLVKDHTAGDKEVVKLAKEEKIDLGANTPPMEMKHLGRTYTGSAFDDAFAKDMLEDHDKDIAAVTTARDATTDPQLKALLTELLPVLQKHREMAQKLVDDKPVKKEKDKT